MLLTKVKFIFIYGVYISDIVSTVSDNPICHPLSYNVDYLHKYFC